MICFALLLSTLSLSVYLAPSLSALQPVLCALAQLAFGGVRADTLLFLS